MANVAIAESAKRTPPKKVLHHLEIHPRMGGGHTVQHHFTSYQHEPEHYHFTADEGDKAMNHVASHAGLPHPQIDEQEDSEAKPWYEHETQSSFSCESNA